MNGHLRLRWHPFLSSGPYVGQPLYIKVRAWIEKGCRLKRKIVDPTFAWCPEVQSGERDTSQTLCHKPYSLDLMTITRILVPDRTEHIRFPFAHLKRSFIIWLETHKDPILFEASSSVERDRIIYGLKLIISQLVSRIMMGDASVLADYFSVTSVHRI